MKNTIVKSVGVIVVLILAGVGGFLYATRPVVAPDTASTGVPQASQITPGVQEPPSNGSKENTARPTSNTPLQALAGEKKYTIAPKSSQASFTIDEVIRGSPFTVVGTTADVTGDIVVDTLHPEKSHIGTITINAQTLHTDNPRRDGMIARAILHSTDSANQYIVFMPKSITGFPKTFSSKSPSNLTIDGDLTVSGITHSVTFHASNVVVSQGALMGVAQATLKRSDYHLVIPNIPFVANVPDTFMIKINLAAQAAQ